MLSRPYYRARYYDPSTGRFLSEDPLQFAGGTNFYRFVLNNPINFVDPSGLLVEILCEPVQQKHVGFLADAVHCRLHDVGDGFNLTFEWLGGNGPGSLKEEPFDPSRPGYKVPVKRPHDDRCSSNDFEKCLKDAFERYLAHPEMLPDYDWWHSNSNAFVLQLVRGCGGDADYRVLQFNSLFDWIHVYGVMPSK